MGRLYGLDVEVGSSIEAVVRAADLLLTVTSAHEPLVQSEWVKGGTHITAVGADMPGKQELDPRLLARAKLIVDRVSQAATQGELQHALAAGLLKQDDVWAELGDILIGKRAGRSDDVEVTIADLTGVGVLDAAVAELVLSATDVEGRPHAKHQ
jgi:ornithine cyclodeaminase/alanine dehydrogenase-like protein (mu-crystallin family)